MQGLGFRVWDLGFGVEGLGLSFRSGLGSGLSGSRVLGGLGGAVLGFRAKGRWFCGFQWFTDSGSGFRDFRVKGRGLRSEGLEISSFASWLWVWVQGLGIRV